MDLFNTQIFRLTLATGIDLRDATALKILYRTPGGLTGSWMATLDPNDSTRMYVDLNSLSSGGWSVYGKATFPSGVIPGRPATFTITRESL